MSTPPFEFYEEVIVASAQADLAEVAGELGVILGMTEGGGAWSCAVLIYVQDRCWCIDSSDLKSTGRKKKRKDFYGEKSVRVTDEGKIID